MNIKERRTKALLDMGFTRVAALKVGMLVEQGKTVSGIEFTSKSLVTICSTGAEVTHKPKETSNEGASS